jgi:hypothetical protein
MLGRERVGQSMDQRRPVAGGDVTPGREGLLGAGDRGVGLLDPGLRHLGHRPRRRRLDHAERAHRLFLLVP